ncbi:MAG: hypothetical protein WBP61_13120 [Nocardioides sp.]
MSALAPAAVAALLLAVIVPAPALGAAPPPSCQGRPATIVGTAEADEISGTSGDDVVVALGGDDTVRGRGGDDLICGGDGADELRGGPGDDRLHGERDAFHNFRGTRYLVPDVLVGGAGDDLLDVGDDDRPVSFGSHGVIDYARAARGVSADLASGTVTGQGLDTVVVAPAPDCGVGCYGVAVVGSAHDDVLLGSADGDLLIGLAGDDRIEGRDGGDELRGEDEAGLGPADDDTMIGGGGDDILVANAGRDLLQGDVGDDTVWSTGGGPSQVFGGEGDDRLAVQLARRPGFVLDGGAGRDRALLAGPRSRPGGGGRPTAALVTMADGQVVANETAWGSVAGVEDLQLGENVRWEYHGTDQPERLSSDGTWLRAFMYGGDDWVRGTSGPDRIDAGDGTDRVLAGRGRDHCVGAEVARSCEF